MHGSGRVAPTRPIPVIAPPPARSANTTASSCATKWCCAEARARRRNRTCARSTAISTIRRTAGNSPASVSRTTRDGRIAFLRSAPGTRAIAERSGGGPARDAAPRLAEILLRPARFGVVLRDLPSARVLCDAHGDGDTACLRGGRRAAPRRRSRRGRARLRRERQGTHLVAGRASTRLRAHRHLSRLAACVCRAPGRGPSGHGGARDLRRLHAARGHAQPGLRRAAPGEISRFDTRQDRAGLHRADNDARGVTAAFNLNLLVRIRRELDAQVDVSGFRHEAYYNEQEGRIEMHLISRRAQSIVINGDRFAFEEGAGICTEYSYKYSDSEIRVLVTRAGYSCECMWSDARGLFGVYFLRIDGSRLATAKISRAAAP